MNFFDLANPELYIAIFLSIANSVLLLFIGYKFFQILQLSNYRIHGYNLWLKDTKGRYVSRVIMLAILSVSSILITDFLLDTPSLSNFWSYIGLTFYIYFCIVFLQNLYNAPKKTPLKLTNRMNRLRLGVFILMSIITFAILMFCDYYASQFKVAVIGATPVLLIIIIPFANIILSPFEKAGSMKYIMQANRKLKKMPNLIKIGITGSVGKTSTKFILQTILNEKYSVCASPFSYNTTLGITKSIIQYLDFSHQILIAEMGARFKGDIAELCELVEPQIGIITGVGLQHLQTFGKKENIIETKYELVNGVTADGLLVLNGDNEITNEFYNKIEKEKVLTGIANENSQISAKNIQFSKTGSKFLLVVKNVGEIECETVLLGNHNIENILMAVAVAVKLGLTLNEIKNGIFKIQSIEHRLQPIHNNGITILDDSYNGSVDGYKCALNVLRMFDGKKIIVTPGLVELGQVEKEENVKFGKALADVADSVIIVNVMHSVDIKEGLLASGFDESQIFQVDNLNNAQLIIKKIAKENDTILFYNDLPDNYI